MTNIDRILGKIEFLPPFPITISKALGMLNLPKVTTEEIAETIKFDQAVASNVLKLCNSSYFGLRRSITNLNEALVYIGLSQLRKILVLSGTRQYFENKLAGYETYKGELWRHSLATSIIATKINQRIEKADDDQVFITALLHDVGKLVLSEFVTDETREILRLVDNENYAFRDAELKVLGIDHAELGAKILGLWNFSEEIIQAVSLHHSEFDANDSDLVNIIRLADSIAITMGYETTIDGMAYKGYPEAMTHFKLNQAGFDRIISDAFDEIEEIEKEYGIQKEEG